MKIVAYIGAAILIFFGTIMIWGSFDPVSGNTAWLPVGLVLLGVGLVIIFFASRRKAVDPTTNVTLNVDLPGNTKMDSMKCNSCGGVLGAKDINMVQGAPMVTCPYCHTIYQLTEEPKW